MSYITRAAYAFSNVKSLIHSARDEWPKTVEDTEDHIIGIQTWKLSSYKE